MSGSQIQQIAQQQQQPQWTAESQYAKTPAAPTGLSSNMYTSNPFLTQQLGRAMQNSGIRGYDPAQALGSGMARYSFDPKFNFQMGVPNSAMSQIDSRFDKLTTLLDNQSQQNSNNNNSYAGS